MVEGDLVPIGSLVRVLDRGFWGEPHFPWWHGGVRVVGLQGYQSLLARLSILVL